MKNILTKGKSEKKCCNFVEKFYAQKGTASPGRWFFFALRMQGVMEFLEKTLYGGLKA